MSKYDRWLPREEHQKMYFIFNCRLCNERNKPFEEWSVDAICGWFEEMGLGIYEDDLKKWLKIGGADLMNVTSLDIEKEINLKSALHRKKIVLALNDITGKETDELCVNAGKLDTVWVSFTRTFMPINFESD